MRKEPPAVIVSNDSCNRYGTRVVVLPITSNVTALYPGEAMVSVKGKPGRALGDQIRSIDKGRLKARAGAVTTEEMAVCSQNRIRSKSAWGHGDLPQKPRFSWSERYFGNQSRTRQRPGPQTQDHSACILTANAVQDCV